MPDAIVLRQFGLGNLRVEAWTPEPLTPGAVRVAMRAVSLNRRDLLMMQGVYDPGVSLPLVPLSAGAGVVTEAAGDVRDPRAGDRVVVHVAPDWQDGPMPPDALRTSIGGPAQGLLCEERVLPARAVLRIPDAMPFEHAACLPVAGLAAWSALHTIARVGPGSRVLLQGSGGLATLALVMARAAGAHVAIASTQPGRLDQGAELVVDRRVPDWGSTVRDWSGGGVDAVLDVSAAPTLDNPLRAVRDGGTILVLGTLGHGGRQVDVADLIRRRIRLQGVVLGSRTELTELIEFFAVRRLDPPIGRIYDGLGAARRAIAEFVGGGLSGQPMVRV